jgi:2-polyprenyl-3-methyl-5-hydroxy-6-metoxy-1,4-benzoquinol methylase
LEGFDLGYLTSMSRYSVNFCPACGITYTLPRLDPDQLAAAYPKDYESWGASLRWLGPHRKVLQRATSRLSGVLPYAELFHPDVINPHRFGTPANILEVGCGSGALLVVMQSAGWTVLGIEPGPLAAEQARKRGIPVVQSSLEACNLAPGHYNVIILHHVLEHVVDLNRSIDQLQRALAPGGRIYIALPNFESGARQFFGPCWIHLDLPRHRFHFTPDSLRHLLAQHRLKVVDEYHIYEVQQVVQSVVNLYLNHAMATGTPSARRVETAIWIRRALSSGLGRVLSWVFGRILSRVTPNRGTAFAFVVEKV